MFKIVEAPALQDEMPMKNMPPCSLACIIEGQYKGHIVLRTASQNTCEVMNLTEPDADFCWTGKPLTTVKMLEPGEKITLEVT